MTLPGTTTPDDAETRRTAVGPVNKPHSCRECGARWSGLAACHCAGCCQTFGGITPFDAHRVGGTCRAPLATRGVTRLVDGVWRGPEYRPAVTR